LVSVHVIPRPHAAVDALIAPIARAVSFSQSALVKNPARDPHVTLDRPLL
jgi:hypothetical protein